MEIDDPKAAFEKQYLQEEERSLTELSVFIGKLAFPKAALPLEIFKRVADNLKRPSVQERFQAFFRLLVAEIEHLDTTKADAVDITEASASSRNAARL